VNGYKIGFFTEMPMTLALERILRLRLKIVSTTFGLEWMPFLRQSSSETLS